MNVERTVWFLLLGLANLNLVDSRMVINEVMINSPKATDALTQWFELHNTGTATVALSGYRLEYFINGVSVELIEIKTNKTIVPNGFFVIGNNGDTAKNGGVVLDLVINPGRAFETDGRGDNFIALYSPFITLEYLLRWSTNDAGPPGTSLRYPFLAGSSLARVSPVDLTQRLSNWAPSTSFINCNSATDKGTPGKANAFACPASTKAPTKAPTKSPVFANSKIVINEIMLGSPRAKDVLTQWYELYNSGDSAIALNGSRLEYLINGVLVELIEIKTNKTIGPNGYFVIGNNGDTVTNGGLVLDLVINPGRPFETDGRGDNFIALYRSFPSVEDRFRWSTNDTGPSGTSLRYPFLAGSSLARVSVLDLTECLSNWAPSTSFINCNSASDKGTPGKTNSFVCPKKTTCGLFGLSIFCLNGCGIIGRLLNFCSN